MIPAFYIFIAMVVIGVILYIHDRVTSKSSQKQPEEQPQEPAATSSDECTDDCCGTHDVCPSEMLLKNMNQAAVYYEDEELDDFRGRQAGDYSADELEQWRDVLYTLQHDELLPWERSIKKRGIVMPEIIREELMSIYNN